MFERSIIEQLKQWKNKPDRKPMMMLGARQVGKTFVLKQFGKEEFEHCAYFSLDEENGVSDIFRRTNNPARIVEQLSFLNDTPIESGKTLLVLDEIQSCPEAISSLKYFCEQMPELAVACAGSLLGITLGHEGFSFPVGKVDHINIYPLTFSEFLRSKDKGLYRFYQSVTVAEPLPEIFFNRLTDAFTAYRICGGMPEAAMKMLDANVSGVEEKLRNILKDYSFDIVKHSTPLLANRISYVWNSLPSQLAKENRKFLYQLVRPGARAREYEDALLWLQNAGLIHKVNLCSLPRVPLKSYEDLSIFKIYALDIGILRVLSELDASIYLSPSPAFVEYKGALTENYILQSLIANGINARRYWSSGNRAEVDFLIQRGTDVIPVEVKSDTNIRGKSLVEYEKKYSPSLRIRYSMLNLTHDGNLINIPLFLADKTELLCQNLLATEKGDVEINMGNSKED